MIFPKTIAQGEAFCNRDKERKRLQHNFKSIQHTLVLSPRRYGKTSLILRVIEEINWPYAYIDLFLAFEEHKIIERFLDGIALLVASVIPINIKAIAKIRDFFKSFSVSLTAGNVSLSLKLESANKNPATTLRQAIQGLEDLLKKYKKKAIFFVDEMQDIVKAPICADIEAILRFYAQNSKNISFIFSGSNRKLLQEIFDDRARPLFKMCDRLNLHRISEQDYLDFINEAAQKKWTKKLDSTVSEKILFLTESHPYYVNYLCSNLWRLEALPTVDLVEATWEQMCNEEASGIAMDIESLSQNQKKLLEYIAQKGTLTNPAAQEHQQSVHLTSRGILQSLKGLLEKDIVEKISDGIRITDPMLKNLLLK